MSEEPGITLGVCMAERDFECLLCGKPFSRFCGDLIVPEYQVCDECLAKVNHLHGRELWAYIEENRIDSKENPNP
jgi:hypothetical protein